MPVRACRHAIHIAWTALGSVQSWYAVWPGSYSVRASGFVSYPGTTPHQFHPSSLSTAAGQVGPPTRFPALLSVFLKGDFVSQLKGITPTSLGVFGMLWLVSSVVMASTGTSPTDSPLFDHVLTAMFALIATLYALHVSQYKSDQSRIERSIEHLGGEIAKTLEMVRSEIQASRSDMMFLASEFRAEIHQVRAEITQRTSAQ